MTRGPFDGSTALTAGCAHFDELSAGRAGRLWTRLGDFGRRNPRDVMGQIYPESHSSSSREVRRKHRRRTEEF